MSNPSKWLARRLPIVLLLAVLALLRAERGVAELQGRADGPSRLLHMAPAEGGQVWALSLLGHEVRVPSPATLAASEDVQALGRHLLDQVERIKEALP